MKSLSFLGLPDPAIFFNLGAFSSIFDLKNLLPVITVFTLVGFFLGSFAVSGVIDNRKAAELAELARAHLLMYGEVSGGIGRDVLHLPVDHPERVQFGKTIQSLRVCDHLCICCILSSCSLLRCSLLACVFSSPGVSTAWSNDTPPPLWCHQAVVWVACQSLLAVHLLPAQG